MPKYLIIGPNSYQSKHFQKLLDKRGESYTTFSLRNADVAGIPRRFDIVVDFSAMNVVAKSWDYPEDYMTVNVLNHLDLLDHLEMCRFKRYVMVSTPEVYGQRGGRHAWGHDFLAPSTPYAASRASFELWLRMYGKAHSYETVITRACNVYGEDQPGYRLIPKVISYALRGMPFPLEGGGKSKRVFMHVSTMVRGIWRAANDDISTMKYDSVHITYADQQAMTIKKVVETIHDAIKKRPAWDTAGPTIEHRPGRQGQDPAYSLENDLSLTSSRSFERWIEACIDYQIEHGPADTSEPT